MGWVSVVHRKATLCLLVLTGLVIPHARGQGVDFASRPGPAPDNLATPPAFEVVSIKPSPHDDGHLRLQFTADGFRAVNVTLHVLLVEAFGLDDDQVINEPDWANKREFDIDARVDGQDVPALHELSFDQRREMFRQILTERFGLTCHSDTRQLPVFALVIGKNGAKLKQSAPVPNAAPITHHGPGGMAVSPGRIVATSTSMPYFTDVLSNELGRTVVDRTGLDGSYDINLAWTPAEGEGGAMPSADDPPPSDASDPSIFTAVQEQLGLKLQSEKTWVQVIVVDKVHLPEQN